MSSVHTCSTDSVVTGKRPHGGDMSELLRAMAANDGTVLITGESGSSKEAAANMIHHLSRRRFRPFIAASCAISSETLIESELFGHVRGAFTGALKDKPGLIERAQSGTVFLDDVDDLPLSTQGKLLRFLQSHTVLRLGGLLPSPVDVRIIAGSRCDLEDLVAQGKLRDDLYRRLNVLAVTLAPLRECREHIPALMDHFLARFFHERGRPVPPIPPAVRRAFVQYSWPGDVEELESLCERMALTCVGGRVEPNCLPAAPLQASAAADGEVLSIEAGLVPEPTIRMPAESDPLPVTLVDGPEPSRDDRFAGLGTSSLSSEQAADVESTVILLARFRAGDPSAVETLFRRYLPPLRQWARGRLPRFARDLLETEDIVQEAMVHTFRRLDQFELRHDGALHAYLRQAVVNRIRDEARKAQRRPASEELDTHDHEDQGSSPLEQTLGQEALARYEQALGRLRDEDRQAVVLRVERGLAYAEIAEGLGKNSADAARMTVTRALVKLATEMEALG